MSKMPVAKIPLESVFLNDLNASIFLKLTEILDINGAWRNLIGVLPDGTYSASDVYRFENSGSRMGESSPSSRLLLDMGSKGIRVGGLIKFLEELQLERALILIKSFEPVQLTEPLPPRIVQQAGTGTRLRLECFATGFPRPSYQWFKFSHSDDDWIEIRDQQQSTLDIEPVRFEDDGLYCCGVYNINYQDNKKSHAFSTPCKIEINAAVVTMEKEPKIANQNNEPVIVDQPIRPCKGPIYVGASLALSCKAKGQEPLIYQWYMNGVEIEGANSCEIRLDNLQPMGNKNRIEVLCTVTNSTKKIVPFNVVSFSLIPQAEESVEYTAEDKVALLIGNETYAEHPSLNCSVMDVMTLAHQLRKMNFKVFCLINLTRDEMSAIVDTFCKFLREGVYGLFYYAGHSFKCSGQHYMLPVNAMEHYSYRDCLCLEDVQERMQRHPLELSFIIFDGCRSVINDSNDKPRIYEPKCKSNAVRFFSTASFSGASDGISGKNGMFMKHLKNNICAKKKLLDIFYTTMKDISVEGQYSENTYNLVKPLSLWDNVKSDSTMSAQMNSLYQGITEQLDRATIDVPDLDAVVTIDISPCEFLNVLTMRLSARPLKFCDKTYIAIVNKFETTDQSGIKFEMIYEQDSDKCVTVVVYDLQKVKEPLVMIVTLCCDGVETKHWRILLKYPSIDQLQIWDRIENRRREVESGFMSDISGATPNNSAIGL